MQNRVCKIISFSDVESEFKDVEGWMEGLGDGWMVWESPGRFLVTSYRFSINSASKQTVSGKPT